MCWIIGDRVELPDGRFGVVAGELLSIPDIGSLQEIALDNGNRAIARPADLTRTDEPLPDGGDDLDWRDALAFSAA